MPTFLDLLYARPRWRLRRGLVAAAERDGPPRIVVELAQYDVALRLRELDQRQRSRKAEAAPSTSRLRPHRHPRRRHDPRGDRAAAPSC